MSFCPSCGKPLTAGASNCGYCGAFVGTQVNAAPVAAPGTVAAGGMTVNAAGALCYLAGFITGVIFLLIDPYKRDPFVKFHAFQSIFFNVAWIGLWIVWGILGFILGSITHGLFFIIQLPVNLLLMLGGFGLWAYLMYSAYQGKTFKLPVIGGLAAQQAGL
jgi:uncharacterized membrane protein